MKVLIIDDSRVTLLVLKEILEESGYSVITMQSAVAAFEFLGLGNDEAPSNDVDLIIMGLVMPEVDGIEATARLKSDAKFKDIPVIILTAKTDDDSLRHSFDAGAADFVNKNFNKVELHARVRSLLKLKEETDRRKEFFRQLEVANNHLKRLSSLDGLTGIANRRTFDEFLDMEWKRATRDKTPLSVVLVDIDCFKPYNDNYGHQLGDETLKSVATAMASAVSRPSDLAARYGGEEFTLVLSNTDSAGAMVIAEAARKAVQDLHIKHEHTKADADCVTLSLGVATMEPERNISAHDLVEESDKALYIAKETGRNQSVPHKPE